MSDIISSGFGGPAADIFRVTSIDRDSGRNSGQPFADMQEDEEDGEGGGRGRKGDSGVESEEVIDDVILSDLARRAMEEQEADGYVPVVGRHAEELAAVEERSRGGVIDIKA